jgi:hypothetical protein
VARALQPAKGETIKVVRVIALITTIEFRIPRHPGADRDPQFRPLRVGTAAQIDCPCVPSVVNGVGIV